MACNSEIRIKTLPWVSPDTALMIIRIELEADSLVKTIHPHSVSFQPDRAKHQCNLARQCAGVNAQVAQRSVRV